MSELLGLVKTYLSSLMETLETPCKSVLLLLFSFESCLGKNKTLQIISKHLGVSPGNSWCDFRPAGMLSLSGLALNQREGYKS